MNYLLLISFFATLCSQSAMDFFIFITSIALIAQVFRKKGPEGWRLFYKMGLEYFWVLWVLVVAVGFLLNSNTGNAFLKKLFELHWILTFYLIVSAYHYVQPSLKKMLKALTGVSLFISAIALIIFFIKGEERLGGILGNPMTTAHSYSIVFLVLAGVFLSTWRTMWSQSRSEFYLLLFSLSLLGATLTLTMTRGVWIAIVVGILVISVVLSRWVALASSVIIGGVVFGMTLLWPKFHDRILYAFDYQNNYDNLRIVLWKTNWMIFSDHPWFGAGYGENTTLLKKYYALQGLPEDQFVGHAHNQFLHMLAGTGIVGLLCYCFMYFFFVVMAWQLYRSSSNTLEKAVGLGIFGALVGFVFGGLTESNFEHAKVRMVLIFTWGLLVYLKGQNSSKNSGLV